jgi:hypothetical protein
VQFPAQLYIGRDPHEGSFLKGTVLFLAGLAFGAALTFLAVRADIVRADGPAGRPTSEIASPRTFAPPAPPLTGKSNPPPAAPEL